MAKPELTKTQLHPRNKHRGSYDFDQLMQANPALAPFVQLNAYQTVSIDFANPQAVKALNQALLKQFYAVAEWDIPAQYLCPPIPGRADYVHYLADLLAKSNGGVVPVGEAVRVLDIGVGANLIYPLIGHHEYGWRFVGADIDANALKNAQCILEANFAIASHILLRQQASVSHVFKGIVQADDWFDLTLCNPPFHASLAEAQAGTKRKWQGLAKPADKGCAGNPSTTLNFGGQAAELYCAGGEEAFVCRMVVESQQFAAQCLWFTSLISKATSLPGVYRALKNARALEVQTIDMAQGQKKSRMVAWTFQTSSQRLAWRNRRW